MKRIIVVIIVALFGMALSAQDMSYYTAEYKNPDETFLGRLEILESVREAGLNGIGDFYHDALQYLIVKLPEIRNKEDQDAAEASARLLCKALGEEKYSQAAPEFWQLAESFDVIKGANQGLVMQDALIALGQVDAKEYVPQIVQRLHDFNTQPISDAETRRRIQRAVIGAVTALEALHDPAGFRPVFFVANGGYDTSVKAMASVALPNIVDDPGEIIAGIIQDNSVPPAVKYEAWREMLRTKAPDASKAKVAAAALDTGWRLSTSVPAEQRVLRETRKSAIDTIRLLGAADNSVYGNLEKSYSANFINPVPDYEEIQKALSALSALKTDEAVQLLLKFLRELNDRRRNGPWTQKERQLFQWTLLYMGRSGTQSQDVRLLLTAMQRSSSYTGNEQTWARNALRELGM